MNNPLVSVIIPLYNAEKYIEETLHSVVNQTYRNIEIIIVNDGSTDNSLILAQSFANEKVKVFTQKNKGASSARNHGLKEAKGEYIQFLDADDILAVDKIESQIFHLDSEVRGTIAYCSTVHFFDGENYISNYPSEYEESFVNISSNSVKFITNLWGGYRGKGSMMPIHCWLTPKSLIDKVGKWDEELSLDDDGEFFARVVLRSNKIIYTKGTFCYYRKFKNSNSLSSGKNKEAYRSLLLSITSKKAELLSVSSSEEAKIAIYRLAMELAISTYGKYPEIYKQAINLLPKIKYPYPINLEGGNILRMISRTFGWRTAKRLQLLIRKIK